MMYVGANREDEGKFSQAITHNAKAGGNQPGQGTMWGGGTARHKHQGRWRYEQGGKVIAGC